MNWSICLVLFSSVVFSTQIKFVLGEADTPWDDTQSTESFIASFLTSISRSNAFSSRQLDDMYAIRKPLTAAMEKFNSSDTSLKTKFQTLNIVFSSAIAEIIAAERGGVSIELKINAIENALNSACLETIGMINMEFVSDIKTLIYTLAHSTANGVSTNSVVKVGDNKQGSLRQQFPYTSAKIIGMNRSVPQRGKGIAEQEPSALRSSVTPNITGTYRPTHQSVTRPKGPLLKIPLDQQDKWSLESLNIKSNSHGPSDSEPHETSPQVPGIQDRQELDEYSTGTSKSSVKGTGKRDPDYYEQTVNDPRQKGKYRVVRQDRGGGSAVFDAEALYGSYGMRSATIGLQELLRKGGKRPSAQELYKAGSQRPTITSSEASDGYEVGSVATGEQGPTWLRRKGPGSQETIKVRNQGTGGYGTNAAASATVGENEFGGGSKGTLGQRSSGSTEEDVQGMALVQRPEGNERRNYAWGASSSAAEGISIIKPVKSTKVSKGKQGTTGKNVEGSSGARSRAVATVATGNYVPSTGAGRYQLEGKDVQGSSRTGSQVEKDMREQALSGKRSSQAINRSGDQETSGYTSRASAAAAVEVHENGSSSNGGVSGIQAPSGQGLGTRRPSKTGSQAVSYGLNGYGRGTAAAAATVASGSESRSGTKRLNVQGQNSSVPASEVRNSYASAIATAVAAASRVKPTPVKPTTAPRISPGDQGPEASSSGSSSVSSRPIKISALSNTDSSPVSQVGTANSCSSNCDTFIQTLLEIILSLVHLLEACNAGHFDDGASTDYASMSVQSAAEAFS